MTKQGKKIKEIFNKSRPRKCYFANENCDKIIKAHSIQNNKILKKISSDSGCVIKYEPSWENIFSDSDDDLLVLKGRKIATTFTGLCNHHDNKIFQPIDDNFYIPSNKQQDFLYAFKAFLYEFFQKEHISCFYDRIIKENLISEDKQIIIKGYKEEIDIAIATGHKYLLNKFKKNLREKHYENIISFNLIFNEEYYISVNSAISACRDLKNNLIFPNYDDDLLFLNIFPENDKTYVIFSCFKNDEEQLRIFEKQILELNDNKKIRFINNFLIFNSDNFVINSKAYSKISKDQKKKFEYYFKKTALRSLGGKYLLSEDVPNLFQIMLKSSS